MSIDGFEQRQAHEDDLAAQRWDSLMIDEQLADERTEQDLLDRRQANEQQELVTARHFFNLARLELKRAYNCAVDPTMEPASAIAALRSAHLDVLFAKGDLLRAMLRATHALRGGR
nr:hypothetical protein [uncultured Rhodopila sp.]